MPSIIEVAPAVFRVNRLLATRNLAPGQRVYGERLIKDGETEFRVWDLFRSKLAAAIDKGLKEMPIAPGRLVLYLGASTGTTPSHVSDIVGPEGAVFAVEFAQRSMRDLLRLCESRPNLLPIFGDAHQPEKYAEYLQGHKVDVVYQDVAQPDQAEIFIKNADAYLKKGGHGMVCIKSQSIDVTQTPEKSYRQTIAKLEAAGFTTLQTIILDPYDKDHMFWHGKK